MPLNSYLTGELINTSFIQVSTMKMACEAGKITAQSIINMYGANKTPYVVLILSHKIKEEKFFLVKESWI